MESTRSRYPMVCDSPRMGETASNREAALIHSTGAWPAGVHSTTCAPWS